MLQEEKVSKVVPSLPKERGHDSVVEERQLWQQFKKGDREAFTQIYNKYIFNLYSYGDKIAADKTLVEDCIHDLWVELWKQKEKLGDTSSIKYYLFKGLKRKIIKVLHKKNKQAAQHDNLSNNNFNIVFSPELQMISTQLDEDRKKHLAKALQRLSKREKEIIYLRFYDGLSYEEIASLMDISVKTAYNSVHNAIGHLRQHLNAKAEVLLQLLALLLLGPSYYF